MLVILDIICITLYSCITMIYRTNITQKGQVTIPKPIRDELRLKPNIQVIISYEDKSLKIRPSQTILDLAGVFKPKKVISALTLRQNMSQNYGKR